MRGLLFATSVLGLVSFDAQAASKAAQFILDQHIAELCSGGGRFNPTSQGIALSEESDLTGDGRKDFIFDSRGIECNDGTALIGCGPAACNVYFYVRRDGLLHAAGDAFSIGFTVGKGKPPRIELQDRNFEKYSVRWNGSGFE